MLYKTHYYFTLNIKPVKKHMNKKLLYKRSKQIIAYYCQNRNPFFNMTIQAYIRSDMPGTTANIFILVH